MYLGFSKLFIKSRFQPPRHSDKLKHSCSAIFSLRNQSSFHPTMKLNPRRIAQCVQSMYIRFPLNKSSRACCLRPPRRVTYKFISSTSYFLADRTRPLAQRSRRISRREPLLCWVARFLPRCQWQ